MGSAPTMRPQDNVFAVDSDSDDEHKDARPLINAHSASLRRFKPPRRSFAIAIGVFLLFSFGISLYVNTIDVLFSSR